MDNKKLGLIRALLTFGGDKQAPTNAEVQYLPGSPVGGTIGYEWDGPDENEPEDKNQFYLSQKSRVKRKGIDRSLMKSRR